MRVDHDSSYKSLFAHPELVCELLAAFLPFPWAHQLKAEACRRVNASYATDGGQQRHDDMVWQVRTGGEPGELYLLLEFQSLPERCMALRLLVYGGLLLQDLQKQGLAPSRKPLPELLPVVLYSGVRPWLSPLSLMELRLQEGDLGAFQPEQRYLLIDLVREAAAQARSGENIVLALFQCSRPGAAEDLSAAWATIGAWLLRQTNAALQHNVTRWVTRHLRRRYKRISIGWNNSLEEASVMMYISHFEEFLDQFKLEVSQAARQKGLLEGRQEGRQEGRGQVLGEVLQRMLEHEGQPLSPAAIGKLAAASPDQLQEWLDQVIDGQRPAALLDLCS
jgi:predicted transposase YdaD